MATSNGDLADHPQRAKFLILIGAALIVVIAIVLGIIYWPHPPAPPGTDVESRSRIPQGDTPDKKEPKAAFVPGDLLIQFKPDATPEQRAQIRQQLGGELKEKLETQMMKKAGPGGNKGGLELISLTNAMSASGQSPADENAIKAVIEKALAMPGVQFAEPNYIFSYRNEFIPSDGDPSNPNARVPSHFLSNDPYYMQGKLWGMYSYGEPRPVGNLANAFGTQADKAWANGHVGSSQVYVAVIDTGIQFDHPDLRDNFWKKRGWDFYDDDDSVFDLHEDPHGTHVAGIIGARGGNSVGVAGINWKITLISAKFLGQDGKGSTVDAIKAFDYVTDLKVSKHLNIVAINASWSSYGKSKALLGAIKRAAAADILCIAAASNEGLNNDKFPAYPASYDTQDSSDGTPSVGYDSVISVAAIDKDGKLASFSNFGVKSVHIGAPGVDISSTYPPNDYKSLDGTSMAAPHVTGAAALYAASHREAKALEIRDSILRSAAKTDSLKGITSTGGRLDVSTF